MITYVLYEKIEQGCILIMRIQSLYKHEKDCRKQERAE